MKINLLHVDQSFQKHELSVIEKTIKADLEFDKILRKMSNDDEFIHNSVQQVIFSKSTSINDVYFRQDIMKDFEKSDLLDDIYRSILLTMKKKRENWWGVSSQYMTSKMNSALNILNLYSSSLKDIRDSMRKYKDYLVSKGLTDFSTLLEDELSDDYLDKLNQQISSLRFEKGIMIKATIGNDNYSVDYKLVQSLDRKFEGARWYLTPGFQLNPRDEHGFDDLTKRKERVLKPVVDALVDAAANMTTFFENLHFELAFYKGCLNLLRSLKSQNISVSYPNMTTDLDRLHFKDLKDVALILGSDAVVGNSLNVKDDNLFVITGANQGGKTTFLRSIGQAILMMRCGMFVAADHFSYRYVNQLFTHFKKEEDKTLESGKFEEELKRMKDIVAIMQSEDVILLNESFSSTNESEGSEIAYQMIETFKKYNIGIYIVTHFYKLSSMLLTNHKNGISLVAQRLENGSRTYQIVEGIPTSSSFGKDIFSQIFKNG